MALVANRLPSTLAAARASSLLLARTRCLASSRVRRSTAGWGLPAGIAAALASGGRAAGPGRGTTAHVGVCGRLAGVNVNTTASAATRATQRVPNGERDDMVGPP